MQEFNRRTYTPPTEIYADGSCPVQHSNGAWAFAVLQTDRYYEAGFEEGPQTNNTMELCAVLNAFRWIKREKRREECWLIRTDSMYVINGMVSGWRHFAAESNFEGEVNGDWWRRLHAHAEHMPRLKFLHVKGHAGSKWNEYVDRMAARALREGKAS